MATRKKSEQAVLIDLGVKARNLLYSLVGVDAFSFSAGIQHRRGRLRDICNALDSTDSAIVARAKPTVRRELLKTVAFLRKLLVEFDALLTMWWKRKCRKVVALVEETCMTKCPVSARTCRFSKRGRHT